MPIILSIVSLYTGIRVCPDAITSLIISSIAASVLTATISVRGIIISRTKVWVKFQNIFNHFARRRINQAAFLRSGQYSVNFIFDIFLVTPEKKFENNFSYIQKYSSLNYKPRKYSGLIWLKSFSLITEPIIFKIFSFSRGK